MTKMAIGEIKQLHRVQIYGEKYKTQIYHPFHHTRRCIKTKGRKIRKRKMCYPIANVHL
jgi:hypothetical protein